MAFTMNKPERSKQLPFCRLDVLAWHDKGSVHWTIVLALFDGLFGRRLAFHGPPRRRVYRNLLPRRFTEASPPCWLSPLVFPVLRDQRLSGVRPKRGAVPPVVGRSRSSFLLRLWSGAKVMTEVDSVLRVLAGER